MKYDRVEETTPLYVTPETIRYRPHRPRICAVPSAFLRSVAMPAWMPAVACLRIFHSNTFLRSWSRCTSRPDCTRRSGTRRTLAARDLSKCEYTHTDFREIGIHRRLLEFSRLRSSIESTKLRVVFLKHTLEKLRILI